MKSPKSRSVLKDFAAIVIATTEEQRPTIALDDDTKRRVISKSIERYFKGRGAVAATTNQEK